MTPADANSLLGGLTAEEFLRDYWQKRPLLIRNAWPGLENPVSPEELAGLACEEEVHARLVEFTATAPYWQVKYSPFNENDFLTLPTNNWTLLVSECETHIPELSTLIQAFRFIPDWRIDDLMISYATDQGSVGAHVDQYDVFLLQLSGNREWQIETLERSDPTCIENLELAILEKFHPKQSWILQPGDMLYLPPGIPHHGIAVGECLTASIGFRAPSRADCLRDYADFIAAGLADEDRYQDADLELQESSAEISRTSIDKFQQFLQDGLAFKDDQVAEWLGKMLTSCAASELENKITEPVTEAQTWRRNPHARLAFIQQGDRLLFFVNGEMHTLPVDLKNNLLILCEQPVFTISDFPQENTRWTEIIDAFIAEQIIIPNEY